MVQRNKANGDGFGRSKQSQIIAVGEENVFAYQWLHGANHHWLFP